MFIDIIKLTVNIENSQSNSPYENKPIWLSIKVHESIKHSIGVSTAGAESGVSDVPPVLVPVAPDTPEPRLLAAPAQQEQQVQQEGAG